MNRKILFYVVGANLALLLLLTIVHPRAMIQPGPPIEAHRAFETDCFACHTPFIGSRPAKCMQCHKPAEIGRVTTLGVRIANERKLPLFHQELIDQDCVACHSDHKGVRAFRPIGQFSHGLLLATTRDRCDGCHQRPGDSLHREVADACGQCHSQQGWKPATLEHDRLFLLDLNHRSACNTCHIGADYSRYTCYGCHEHSRSGIRAEHLEEGIRDYENCVECHRDGSDLEDGRGERGHDRKTGSGAPRQASGDERRNRHDEDDDDD